MWESLLKLELFVALASIIINCKKTVSHFVTPVQLFISLFCTLNPLDPCSVSFLRQLDGVLGILMALSRQMDSTVVLLQVSFLVEAHLARFVWTYERFFQSVHA